MLGGVLYHHAMLIIRIKDCGAISWVSEWESQSVHDPSTGDIRYYGKYLECVAGGMSRVQADDECCMGCQLFMQGILFVKHPTSHVVVRTPSQVK